MISQPIAHWLVLKTIVAGDMGVKDTDTRRPLTCPTQEASNEKAL